MATDQIEEPSAESSIVISAARDIGRGATEDDISRTGSPTNKQSQDVLAADTGIVASKPESSFDMAIQPLMVSDPVSSPPPLSKDAIPPPAAPYGTRSRNRAGQSRPNYAEDKDVDGDFEVAPVTKTSHGRKATRASAFDSEAPSHSDSGQSTSLSKKAPIHENHNTTAAPKPHASGASSATSTAGPSNPRKRKATGPPAASQLGPPAPTSNGVASQAITRRASMAAQVAAGIRDSNMLSFDNCRGQLKDKRLVADDGTVLGVNDHVYLVCEPPGEPYYLGRIMEFLHLNNDPKQPIESLRLNWYYRPRDIGRKVSDTRQIFASMHSDINSLTALRGKCEIKHRSDIEKMEDVRKTRDCFWYDKLYDRYIHRFFDVVPTKDVINVPVEVKNVLDERWKYILVEPQRGKELTSDVKSCKRCSKYCASNDSVDCAVCKNTYHMSCVSPPLLKKPSRGFAWACGPCSKAQEKKLEARNTPNILESNVEGEEDDNNEEEDGSAGQIDDPMDTDQDSASGASEPELPIHPGTAEQIHHASLWLFRYLGAHCKVEDALDYDDRIYPRASSRTGAKYQVNVVPWPGRPVEYVKPVEVRKKITKGGNKKEPKLSREAIVAMEAEKAALEKRPKWVMDQPPGFIQRGEDIDNDDPHNTARLLFRPPADGEIPVVVEPGIKPDEHVHMDTEAREEYVDHYLHRAKVMAVDLGLPVQSTNLQDVALEILCFNRYNAEAALSVLPLITRRIFKEPDLTPLEVKKFEEGVTKFGSEWHSIKKHVKTVSPADIVRFYYTWKKTKRGKHIWDNYHGRKGKREAKKAEANAGKLQDDVADEYDDSAFDNDKILEKKRGFQCKFCTTRSSRQWRRAPAILAGATVPENPFAKGKEKGAQLMVALCRRCAELWRRYAIQWEDVDDVAKKVTQTGGRAAKRKIDDDLLRELVAANDVVNVADNFSTSGLVSADGTPAPLPSDSNGHDTPRKRLKASLSDKVAADPPMDANGAQVIAQPKKKPIIEAPPPPPPPPPEPPKARVLPCAVCLEMEPMGEQHLACRECRMTVHRHCYGVVDNNRIPGKWTCDMCANDKNPSVSIDYKCVLCPVESTVHDFVGPPKVSHKKKSEKDREKDRIEREIAVKDAEFFQKKQEEMNKPLNPREPLKQTSANNWVHVTCAAFTPEIKFGKAEALMPSEDIASIPLTRWRDTCKECKQDVPGACVPCRSCRASVHVGCAHQHGYVLGFEVNPVKGSRRDQANIVTIGGETGVMTASIWCKEHAPVKTVIHRMNEIVDADTGLNALQAYVRKYKQANRELTGTVRKATYVNQSTNKAVNPTTVPQQAHRKGSANTGYASTSTRFSNASTKLEESNEETSKANGGPERRCITCKIDVSPKWWRVHSQAIEAARASDINGVNGVNGILNNHQDQSIPNGHVEDGPMALAAAALHRNDEKAKPSMTAFRCHKCHKRKVPEASPGVVESEVPHNPPPPVAAMPVSEAPPSITPYTWAPGPGALNSAFNAPWSRHSPTPPLMASSTHLNGGHSPATLPMTQHNGQPHMRQPLAASHLSPHQNGRLPQTPNGYPSTHSGRPASPAHLANGVYQSYIAANAPPQHLTNGGPPPQASEYPPPQSSSTIHSHPFSTPHASPPSSRDGVPGRQSDGRVNGGASASPSLRNLLS